MAVHLLTAWAPRVRFRLGPDVFCEAEVEVDPGQIVTVSSTAALTPLVREALGTGDTAPDTTVISESIGEIQAGILPTMLPIIGIRPFDTNGVVFGQFGGLVPPYDPAQFDLRPLSVVLAADGDGWLAPPAAVLDGVRCTSSAFSGPAAGGPPGGVPAGAAAGGDTDVALQQLFWPGSGGSGTGFDRIRLGVAQAPVGSFQLRVSSSHFGTFRLACAGLPGRATVVTIILRPDGTLDVGQNLLRVPVEYGYDPRWLGPETSYGRVVRDLQLGRKLYESGDLVRPDGPSATSDILTALLYAKWTDPILGCMGYYAWRRSMNASKDPRPDIADTLRHTAMNLLAYFGELPDSRVIHALEFEAERYALLDAVLERGEIPVLAESSRIVARRAQERNWSDAPVVDVARRIATDQIWSLHFE